MNSMIHLAAPDWELLTDSVRLLALSDSGIFATRPERDFDDIVSLAALSCRCSSAMIAFADAENLHFKSTVGATKGLLQIIADMFFIPTVRVPCYHWTSEPAENSSARTINYTEETINFYAGVPIKGSNDQIIGVLCVTDRQPRYLSNFQEQALLALARQTEQQLTLRRMITSQQKLIVEREYDIEIRRQSESQLAAALSRVSLINEIGKTARSGADPATILESAVNKLGAALSADRCYLVTYSPAENRATIGPDWHTSDLSPISGAYKMHEYSVGQNLTQLSGQTAVVHDVLLDDEYRTSLAAKGLGFRALLRAPVIQGAAMTALGVAMMTPRKWTEEEVTLVEAIAAQTRAAVETARHTLREKAMLRDVLASVTEGKLILADSLEQLPEKLAAIGGGVVLDKECGLAELRDLIRTASRNADHNDLRTFDTMTAASEAGMNAIVHAERGIATVSVSSNNTVQVRIEDRGSGIAFDDLPKATLARGYSTTSTLGHGLKMMLETIDRLFLLTGPTGTTVVLEQDKTQPDPSWLSRRHLI